MTSWLWHHDHATLTGFPNVKPQWLLLRHCIPTQKFFSWYCQTFFQLKITGYEKVPPDQPCIFIYNHASHYDGFLMLVAVSDKDHRPIVPVLWYKLLNLPLFGPLVQACRGIPVNNELDSTHSKISSVRAMLKNLKAGRHLSIAPEAVRHDRLGLFHEGAAVISLKSKAPLLPVTLRGVHPLFKDLDRIPKLFGHVEAIFHPPLFPDQAQGSTLEEKAAWLTQAARNQILSALDYPDSESPDRQEP
jgi:1-acyl-sn-glycerol-3-phosphate acyltransferase